MSHAAELKAQYESKKVSASEAAAIVKNGYRVHFGTGAGVVDAMDRALAERVGDLRDVTILSTVGIHPEPLKTWEAAKALGEEGNRHVRFISAHFSAFDRRMAEEGNCWYMPMMFCELPELWNDNGNHIDVAMFQVGPMDCNGDFNLGPQVADMLGVIRGARKIVVEVNENMPFAYGYSNEINIKDVDYIVEGDNPPMATLSIKPPSDVDQEIANHVVNHLESGSTLQIGIGGLPSSIGSLLAKSDINDLNIHTEMFVDAYLDLYEAGKIVNKINLPMNHGRAVYSFAAGSKKLYDFIDNNPTCCCAPVEWVNNCTNIAEINKFVSINSCIGVDIYGQVCAETAGYQQISGTGGQLDFVIGAYRSNGGKSFLCLPSTRVLKNGQRISLISPVLPPGSVVTTPRSCTGFIVTEYGAANLKGKSTWERAEMLINIAHPDFRDELIQEAEKMGIWKRSSKREY
ncbi:MAG: acetyl-CoA hydrolase/transferase C-terminal domain-containing protein [Firmicutes bacterium]|nr:acetyl-CoA hydrolase/transferase C-terminal domain-containing protein [Bacillota bacterium]